MAMDEFWRKFESLPQGKKIAQIIKNYTISDLDAFHYLQWKFQSGQLEKEWNGLLHIAAATGRVDLLENLLTLQPQNINAQFMDNFWTPLYISMQYGEIQCAVRLIQRGANFEIADGKHPWPLEEVIGGVLIDEILIRRKLMVWGNNSNYTLGLENNRDVNNPEPISFFVKQSFNVIKVAMGKYHTVFLTDNGEIYACGLMPCIGLKNENIALTPKKINVACCNKKIKDVCVGEVHTLLLDAVGGVYTSGKNNDHALGLSDPSLISPFVPLQLPSGERVTQICAGTKHSIFVVRNAVRVCAVYVCGKNNGQLGLPKEAGLLITTPTKKVPNISAIDFAATCSDVTVIGNESVINVFYDYQVDTFQVDFGGDSVYGPEVSVSKCPGHSNGYMLAFKHVNYMATFYIFSNHQLTKEVLLSNKIQSLQLHKKGCVFISPSGVGYNSATFNEENGFRRLPRIFNAGKVFCDPEGQNFCVIKWNCKYYLKVDHRRRFPQFWKKMSDLFNEASIDDFIHDIVFKVGDQRIAAHSCIVFHQVNNSKMKDVIKENAGKYLYEVTNMDFSTFHNLLRCMYNPFEQGFSSKCVEASFTRLDPKTGDLTIVTQDNNKINVHRCVLCACMEYFRLMLSNRWQKDKVKEIKISMDSQTLTAMIDVMYKGYSKILDENNSFEFLVSAWKKADEFLNYEFKSEVENHFKFVINQRNAWKVFNFADEFNLIDLQILTRKFISVHKCEILENRSLEALTNEQLKFISIPDRFMRQSPASIVWNWDEDMARHVREISEQQQKSAKSPKNVKTNNNVQKKKKQKTSSISEPLSPPRDKIFTDEDKSKTTVAVDTPTITENVASSSSSSRPTSRPIFVPKNDNTPLPEDSFILLGSAEEFPELGSSKPRQTPPSSKGTKMPLKLSRRRSRGRQISLSSDEESFPSEGPTSPPTSPWSSLPLGSSDAEVAECLPKIDEIMLEEKAERQTIARAVNKPFFLTQMEDKAIRDLEVFYDVGNATDEHISVQRLSSTLNLPAPAWPRKKQ